MQVFDVSRDFGESLPGIGQRDRSFLVCGLARKVVDAAFLPSPARGAALPEVGIRPAPYCKERKVCDEDDGGKGKWDAPVKDQRTQLQTEWPGQEPREKHASSGGPHRCDGALPKRLEPEGDRIPRGHERKCSGNDLEDAESGVMFGSPQSGKYEKGERVSDQERRYDADRGGSLFAHGPSPLVST